MHQKIVDLQQAVVVLSGQVTTAVTVQASLKSKLDAAIAENARLVGLLASASSWSAEEVAAADVIATDILDNAQTLSDSSAVNGPAN